MCADAQRVGHPAEYRWRRGALCGSSVKAKFHYAIQLTNQLASWFASWSASASELNSVMEFGLNSVPCTTPQSLADARCWSAVTLPK